MDILTWQNVQVSGGIFAAGLVWFLMTTVGFLVPRTLSGTSILLMQIIKRGDARSDCVGTAL